MSDALHVRLDIDSAYAFNASAIYQDVQVHDHFFYGVKNRVALDPYTRSLVCLPRQLSGDWKSDTNVTRYSHLTDWSGVTGATWQEIPDLEDRWLMNLGTGPTAEITSIYSFDADTSFLLQFMPTGSKHEVFDVLDFTFGQWTLRIDSHGHCKLYEDETQVCEGYITASTHGSILDEMVSLIVMPLGEKRLCIRRNSFEGGGFIYQLPVLDYGTVIAAGSCSLKMWSGTCRFQLTQLTYDTTQDFEFTTAPITLKHPPQIGQSSLSEDDAISAPTGTGIVIGLQNSDGTPFVADGVSDTLKVMFSLTPAIHKTPVVHGEVLMWLPLARNVRPLPLDIIQDVRAMSLHVGEKAEDTSLEITLINVENYPTLYGASNRMVRLAVGEPPNDYHILEGVLQDPPKYVYSKDGDQYFTMKVASLWKFLTEPNFDWGAGFDGLLPSEAVRRCCHGGNLTEDAVTESGVISADLNIQTSTLPLADTRQTVSDKNTSEWTPEPGDAPGEWIDRISGHVGWIFKDGHTLNCWELQFIDPLTRSTTPVHTFVMSTPLATLTNQILSEWEAWSEEPETNELCLDATIADTGERVLAVYLDKASQDPTLAPASRPDNWLGYKKQALVPWGQVTELGLRDVCTRIGAVVTRRTDRCAFTADWPYGLWTGDVVTITDGVSPKNYRLTKMDVTFRYDHDQEFFHYAHYEAVAI